MTAAASPHRIVIVEGLPGAGKSTTAHLLRLHLQRQQLPVRWWWEHEDPHPVFDYAEIQDALDHGRLRDGLFDDAVERWRHLARAPRWVLLDGSFFQTPLHAMLLNGWAADAITRFVGDVMATIGPSMPLIVLLRPAEPAAALTEATGLRGDWFIEFLDWRIRRSVYGRRHDLVGPEGVARYFEAYAELVDTLIGRLDLPVLILDGPKSDFVDRIAAALDLPAFTGLADAATDSNGLAGTYRAAESDDVYEIIAHGPHLWLDGTPRTRLVRRGDGMFELLGTCVTFEFNRDGEDRPSALHCRGDLPGLAPDWVRVA